MNREAMTDRRTDTDSRIEDIVEFLIMSGRGQEKVEETRQVCIELWRKNPENHTFVFLQGVVNFVEGRKKEAEAWMQKALALVPRSTAVMYCFALMHLAQNNYTAALLLMTRVVSFRPDHARAHAHIGHALRKTGDMAGSLTAFDKSLSIDPHHAATLTGKGNTLKEMGLLSEAAACYKLALDLVPGNPLVINNLGVIRFLSNDLDGAEALYREALSIQPDYPEALSNLSVIRRFRDDLAGAVECSRKALTLRPTYPGALNNLGNTLKDSRLHEEAVEVYREALRFDPGNAEIHKNLAMSLLALGHFDEGWREYKWRWQSKQFSHISRCFNRPEWRGEAGEGRTILIHAEQGFGDTIQFCRYVPMIRAMGFNVLMFVPPQLQRIVRTLAGVDAIFTRTDDIPAFDVHCPMMHLPVVFRTEVETIPAVVPYLRPDAADEARWRERIAALGSDDMKVGLAWAGSSRVQSPDLVITDRKRSVAPECLAPLLDVADVRFFSLQKDGPKAPADFGLIDWTADCRDFADTAALIANLDLVISVDTAVVHLAGAMGKPVWLLNRFNSCWRWFVDREDSPWYPGTLRIFNQNEPGGWDDVVLRIREALTELV